MLLVCPSCRTRYVVPDSAIGPAGRQVRCASCRHSWFQDGPKSVAPPNIAPVAVPAVAEVSPPPPPQQPAPAVEPAPEPAPIAEPVAEQAVIERPELTPPPPPAAAPNFAAFDPPPPPPVAPMIDPSLREPERIIVPPPPSADFEDRSQFAHEPPFRPRRNPAKIMTYAAAAFALVVAVAGGSLWYSGWLEGSFVSSVKEPPLKIVLHDNLDLGRAADGSPFFIASGSIVNPTAETQRVPDMIVTLKDASGRSVYNNWRIKAPVRTLAPGATADFSQLKRDVPLASSKISVNWAL
jgi:predicted Zn finger-like uncharacterized protein